MSVEYPSQQCCSQWRRERYTRKDTGVEKEWYGTMDDSGVVLCIQALKDAKIANKWVINAQSHSDFVPNI